MKKKLLIFFLFILNSSLLKGNSSFPENNGSTINLSKVVNDDEESEGLYAHIPDWHFEYFLYIKGYDDILGDRKVLISNIDTVKIIDFSDESSADYIKTLKGIEYFKTLESFKMVGADSLKAIDLSQNISLKKITLWNIGTRSQRIPALDLSNNLLLEELDARGCHLSELDLSNNIMLKKLRCSGNELKELNLSNNISLKELNCSMNQLSVLDVSNLRDLENLEFNYNNITSIDVSQAPLLKRLSTSFNNLKELNLSNNSLLETLILVSNNLRTIDVSDKPLLRHIALTKNQLNSLDISRNRKLKNLYCAENNLSNLNLSNNLELIELYCQSNQLKNIDVTRHVNLEMLNVSDNDFSTLDVTNNDSLYLLACRNLNLKELDLSNKDLFWLYCDGNLLSDLDLSQQIWLTELYCSNNPLKELNLEHNSELQILSCSNIGLDSLDLSTNPNLYELDCSSNNLKELDLSNNYIKNLDCSSNQLDFLNLKKSPNLGYLNARNNAIECIQIAEKGPVHDIVWNPKKWLVDRARHSINCEFVVYSSVNTKLGGRITSDKLRLSAEDSVEIRIEEYLGYELLNLNLNDSIVEVKNNVYKVSRVTRDLYFQANFQKKKYTLRVEENSNGTLSFDKTEVLYQESATLTVIPNEGYRLKTLKINDEFFSVTSGTYVSENVTTDLVAEAEFDKVEYSISLNNPSNGSLSSSLTEVAHGESVTFTVTPAEGYRLKTLKINDEFFSVTSGTYVSENVTTDLVAEAEFDKVEYSISLNNPSNGSLSSSLTEVAHGESVTFTVTPAEGYRLKTLKINDEFFSVTSGTYVSENVTSDLVAEAEFDKVEYSISLNNPSNGSLSSSLTEVAHGESVTFTVTPAEGYRLKTLKINDEFFSVTSGTYVSENVTTDLVAEAEFDKVEYSISLNNPSNGSLSSSLTEVAHGESVTFTVTPAEGYRLKTLKINDEFFSVTSGTYVSENVTTDLVAEAEFDKVEYSISLNNPSNGSLSSSLTEVAHGESVTFTVTPAEGYRLKTLKINDEFFSVTSGTYVSENVTTDLVAEAEFDKVEYSISLNNPSNGSLSSSLTEVAHGESVTFTVTPAEGYRLKTLKINDEFFSVTSGTYVSENVTTDLVAEAEFDKVEYSISLNNPSNGSLSSSLTEVAHGESVTFTVTPAEGYRLKTLKINDEFFSVTSGTYVSENVTTDLVAEAEFDKVEYSISLNNPSNGSLSSSLTEVAHGESVTFTVTPAEGYRLKTLKINDEFFSVTSGTYVSENVTTDLVAEAEFDKVEYSISLNNPSNGSLSSSLTEVAHGESVTFTVTPAEGYRLKTLKINDEFFSVTSGTYVSENVTTDLVAEAEFDKVEYSISLNNPSNGSLSSSLTEVAHGESVTFTVTPAEGYLIKDVLVNGVRFGDLGTYTVSNVVEDKTIEAIFIEIKKVLSSPILNKVNLYPNPVEEQVTLSGLNEEHNYQVIGLIGNVLYSGRISTANNKINLSALKSGNYYISIDDLGVFKIYKK